MIGDLGRGNIQLNGIVGLDDRIRVTDGATVVRHQVRHVLGAQHSFAHLAQLVLGLLIGDPVNGETSLHVVDQTEMLASLLDGDHICKRE